MKNYEVIIMAILIIMLFVFIVFFSINNFDESNNPNKHELENTSGILKESNYINPAFKPLTQDQIDDIHARGKITPKEKVKEWEDLDLCAPGDAIGSAAFRCKKFRNCHDCLIDYASKQDEYTSFYNTLKACDFKLYKN